jgi:NADP-dependent 3-hydroxy acid dehydrogenase YdfG
VASGLLVRRALATGGWTIVILGRQQEALIAAAKLIEATNRNTVVIYPLDVRQVDEVKGVANAILEKHDQIDLLVNRAGVNVPKRSWRSVKTVRRTPTRHSLELAASALTTEQTGFFFA